MNRRTNTIKNKFLLASIAACIVPLATIITLICIFTIKPDTTETTSTAQSTVISESVSTDAQNSPDSIVTESTDTEAPPISTEHFIPQSAEVDDTFFADTLFIGNSITEGFQKFSGLDNATFYQGRGMTVENIHRMKVVNADNSSDIDGNGDKTIIEALHDRQFNQIYILLGSNELGWVYYNLFINQYADLIDTIRELQPNAKICVQSILPVSAQRSETDEVYTNEKIDQLNQMIIQMSFQKNIPYLNAAEVFKNENGTLSEDQTTDGIHLTPEACKTWYMYIKTHIIQ